MKIKYLFELVQYFVITEIISGIELIIWFQFRDFFISLMYLENDVFNIGKGVIFALVIIPIISLVIEYQTKQRRISEALSKLFN